MEENRGTNDMQGEKQPEQAAPEILAQAYQPETDDDGEETPPRRTGRWLLIGGLLVVFLAAAVFFGARLLKPPEAAGGPGENQMMISKGGPGGGKSVRIDMTPAPEVPQEQPVANGVFVRRDDQSIFIGTGNVQMMMKKSSDNAPGEVSSKYDGPVVEVVTNHQTKIYQDTTEMLPPDSTTGDSITVQQVVKEASLDELHENSMVSVWGEKQGDRYVAKVIVLR